MEQSSSENNSIVMDEVDAHVGLSNSEPTPSQEGLEKEQKKKRAQRGSAEYAAVRSSPAGVRAAEANALKRELDFYSEAFDKFAAWVWTHLTQHYSLDFYNSLIICCLSLSAILSLC